MREWQGVMRVARCREGGKVCMRGWQGVMRVARCHEGGKVS